MVALGPCSSSRARAHAAASTSASSGGPSAAPRRLAGPRRRTAAPPPPRVTNTQKEIWDADDEMREMAKSIDPDRAEFARFDRLPEWDPEKGPLRERINTTLVEEVLTDEINLMETAYWFHTPPDGWNFGERVEVVPEEEGMFPHPMHEEDEELYPHRFPLDHLEEGWEMEGVVTDIWLYHGAQVDFVCQCDGLIPISQKEWDDVQEQLLPGTKVRVRVHRLFDKKLYRWPIQLELLDEKLAPLITPPDEWRCPANVGTLFDEGKDLQQVAEALGRTYRRTKYMVEPDMASEANMRQWRMGWNETDINGYEDDFYTQQLDAATVAAIDAAAMED